MAIDRTELSSLWSSLPPALTSCHMAAAVAGGSVSCEASAGFWCATGKERKSTVVTFVGDVVMVVLSMLGPHCCEHPGSPPYGLYPCELLCVQLSLPTGIHTSSPGSSTLYPLPPANWTTHSPPAVGCPPGRVCLASGLAPHLCFPGLLWWSRPWRLLTKGHASARIGSGERLPAEVRQSGADVPIGKVGSFEMVLLKKEN